MRVISGGSISRAILDGKVSKRCEVYALTDSLYYIVNDLFIGITIVFNVKFTSQG